MRNRNPRALEAVSGVTACVDQALAHLRHGRYQDLSAQLDELEGRASCLSELREKLEQGAHAPEGTRASCDRLGQRLWVLSEVARQLAEIESEWASLCAAPAGVFYDRRGCLVETSAECWRGEA